VLTLGPTVQATLVYIKKYLKAKDELWKLKYFTIAKIQISKNPLKETKINPSRYYYNSRITNLKFQHKPKYLLSKILK
jgi:serine protease inhibitor